MRKRTLNRVSLIVTIVLATAAVLLTVYRIHVLG